jgi:hypothetical protein
VFSLRSTDIAGPRFLGTAGAALVTLAGWSAGVPLLSSPALLVAFCGVTLLVAAWWWAGQNLAAPRSLFGTLACWCAPLAVAPPMFSRDVYSYLAQGAMMARHIDVYAHGVAYLGGPLAAQVPAIWLDAPAPYGPLFLQLAGWNASASGGDLVGGLIGMRLLAIAGVAVFAAILPHLADAVVRPHAGAVTSPYISDALSARPAGARPGSAHRSTALWLGALNPLVPLHLIAGLHNEAVMLALMSAGLLLALKQRYAAAAVAVTLAALVKAPAALALPAVAMMWANGSRILRAAVNTAAIAAVTALAVSTAAGLGLGWIPALRAPAGIQYSWSISSALGRAFSGIVPREFWTSLGVVTAIVLIGLMWQRRDRLGPVYALGLALAAVAFLGPATRPWYALWGLIPIAAAAPAATMRKAAATAAVLAFVVLPSGYGPDAEQAVIAAAGVAAGVLVFLACGVVRPAPRLVPA